MKGYLSLLGTSYDSQTFARHHLYCFYRWGIKKLPEHLTVINGKTPARHFKILFRSFRRHSRNCTRQRSLSKIWEGPLISDPHSITLLINRTCCPQFPNKNTISRHYCNSLSKIQATMMIRSLLLVSTLAFSASTASAAECLTEAPKTVYEEEEMSPQNMVSGAHDKSNIRIFFAPDSSNFGIRNLWNFSILSCLCLSFVKRLLIIPGFWSW